jgi:branched-chain amino acid transport system ATP-binding protein
MRAGHKFEYVTADLSLQSSASASAGQGAAATPVLRTEDLTVRFGGLTALNRVNFEVKRGEIRAIIGPNGAGKSTFFN